MKQIIEDTSFEKGFHLHHIDGLVTRNPVKFLNYGGICLEKPNWKVAQWCSKYNLSNGTEHIYDDYSYEYRDESKYIRSYIGRGCIELGLDASKEYLHPRRENEGWPHILLEQEFSEDYYCHTLNKVEKCVDFQITKYVNKMNDEDRNMLHTVQFQWFFSIQNRNKESLGYGDFFWFGLSFYDYPRYDFPPAFQAQDGGKEENTGKFIHIESSKEFLDKPVTLGETICVKVETLDKIKEAFIVAKERNFLLDCSWEDMCISNMNIGFEVTGTFDVSVMINKLQVII